MGDVICTCDWPGDGECPRHLAGNDAAVDVVIPTREGGILGTVESINSGDTADAVIAVLLGRAPRSRRIIPPGRTDGDA